MDRIPRFTREGYLKIERTTFAWLTKYLKLTAHQGQELVTDRESQSRSAVFFGSGFIRLGEGLKYFLLLVFVNSNTGIPDCKTISALFILLVRQRRNFQLNFTLIGEFYSVT